MFSTDAELNLKYSELLAMLFPDQKAQQSKLWCEQKAK